MNHLDAGALVLGANVFGWTAGEDEAHAVLDGFVEAGGRMIDTADSYPHWAPDCSGGESEKMIGSWLQSRGKRDDVLIATKVSQHPEFLGLSPLNVRRAAKKSLKRLGVDTIDLYYAHFDDETVPMVEIAAAFSALVDAGKIRHIGISNFTPERITEWFRVARAENLHLPVALQPHYNLMERDYEVNGLREVAEAEELDVFPYYALAKGFLAGKYRSPNDMAATGASPRAEGALKYLDRRGKAVLDVMDDIAVRTGAGCSAIALAWVRQQESVTAPIASARNTSQLIGLIESMTFELSAADIEALREASLTPQQAGQEA